MSVELIKKCIKCGWFNEARRLIELVEDIDALMEEDQTSIMDGRDAINLTNRKQPIRLPILIMLVLHRDEDDVINLSRLLIEKGYYLNINDQNGLCALNYAIALKRIKLVNLFLDSFNFELDEYRDCFKNSFLHYIYAVNNRKIIEKFTQVYSKFYEWDLNKFKNIKNCDGLSVHDLYEYSQMMNKKERLTGRFRRPQSTAVSFREPSTQQSHLLPHVLRIESSPVSICSFISNVYKSNSTIKSELIFVLNSAKNLANQRKEESSRKKIDTLKNQINDQTRIDFRVKILYQIRSLSRVKSSYAKRTKDMENNMSMGSIFSSKGVRISPINNEEHMPVNANHVQKLNGYNSLFYDRLASDSIEFHQSHFSNTSSNNESWKGDLKKMYTDYSIVSTASFRPSAKPKDLSSNQILPLGVEQTKLTTELMNSSRTNSTSANRTSSLAEANLTNLQIGTSGMNINSQLTASSFNHTHSSYSNNEHKLKTPGIQSSNRIDIYLNTNSMTTNRLSKSAKRNDKES